MVAGKDTNDSHDHVSPEDAPNNAPPPYDAALAAERDAFVASVTAALAAVEAQVTVLLSQLEKRYRSVWTVERDVYMRRYQRANKPAAAVEADIARHVALGEQVVVEEPLVSIGPLQLDLTPFKQVWNGLMILRVHDGPHTDGRFALRGVGGKPGWGAARNSGQGTAGGRSSRHVERGPGGTGSGRAGQVSRAPCAGGACCLAACTVSQVVVQVELDEGEAALLARVEALHGSCM